MPTVRNENIVFSDAVLVGGAVEISTADLESIVNATAAAGFAGVSLWAFHHLAAVGQGMSPDDVKKLHTDAGLSVPVVESLIGWEGGDTATIDAQCGPTFDVADFYGAKTVAGVVMSPTLESFDAAAAGLAHLGKRGADRGMRVCIEWLPWSGLKDLASAWKLVQAAGGDNLGLVVDTWHWLRQPGGPDVETLRAVPGDRIHLVQIDDAAKTPSGEDPMMESMTRRLLPGDGDVDFRELFAVLDEIGADPIWGPEIFNVDLMGLGHEEMARQIATSTRTLLGA